MIFNNIFFTPITTTPVIVKCSFNLFKSLLSDFIMVTERLLDNFKLFTILDTFLNNAYFHSSKNRALILNLLEILHI